jgi:predicted small secreted protein
MKYLSLGLMTAILASMVFLVSCNTIKGVGQDIQSVGKALEDSAE